MLIWEVTNKATVLRMICGHSTDRGKDAEYDLLKAVLKKAKKKGLAVVAITLTVDENAEPTVTLCGTQDYQR